MTVLRRPVVVVMMTVTRATIYGVTHEREAALNFALSGLQLRRLTSYYGSSGRLPSSSSCGNRKKGTQKGTALSFSTTVSGHIQVVWQSF